MDADTHVRTSTPMPLRVEPDARRADVTMSDWLTLLAAVTGRLRMTAARQSTVTYDEHALDASSRVRADVLDCVDALDRLHAALARMQRPF